MLKNTLTPLSYQKTFPKNLWSDVESLISYVANYPFAIPEYCKFCGSTHFAETTKHSQRPIPQYWCKHCKKTFNQLTNTLFATTLMLELWKPFAELYLAGLSIKEIQKQLTISASAVSKRRNILHSIMQERYPALYKWWVPHHHYQDPKFTPTVKKQANYFLHWLDERINPKQTYIICHLCTKKAYHNSKQIRHYFYCKPCNKGFSTLTGSPLNRLMNHEKWFDFANQLFRGASCYELARSLNTSFSTANTWRLKFIAQAEQLELTELVYWLTWQRKRNYAKENLTRRVCKIEKKTT